MSMYYPAADNTYIPALFLRVDTPPTLEEVRATGVIVAGDGETGLAQTTKGMTVFFSRVTLNPDGTILDFGPMKINKYVQVTSEPSHERASIPN